MKGFFLGMFLLGCCAAFAQEGRVVKVSAGAYDRGVAPVFIPVLKEGKSRGVSWVKHLRTGALLPVQRISDSQWVFIAAPLKAGATDEYRFVSSAVPSIPAVTVERTDSGFLVKSGERPVLFYHTTEKAPGGDTASPYKRSGFIHPLYTPSAVVLTDDFPVGHTHQHGVFSAWVNTVFRGKKTDFWNQHQLTGTARHVTVEDIQEGPVCAQLKLKLAQVSLEHGIVLEESWTVRVYALPGVFMVDLGLEQQNVTTDTLFLPSYHYGGMAFRGKASWNSDDHQHFKERWHVTTAGGAEDSAANHTRARWVWVRGNAPDNGVVLYDHPGNFRYPQPVRVHPVMPYLVFSPVVEGAFSLAPGEKYRAQYRIMTYAGFPGKDRLVQEEMNWTQPVGVSTH